MQAFDDVTTQLLKGGLTTLLIMSLLSLGWLLWTPRLMKERAASVAKQLMLCGSAMLVGALTAYLLRPNEAATWRSAALTGAALMAGGLGFIWIDALASRRH